MDTLNEVKKFIKAYYTLMINNTVDIHFIEGMGNTTHIILNSIDSEEFRIVTLAELRIQMIEETIDVKVLDFINLLEYIGILKERLKCIKEEL